VEETHPPTRESLNMLLAAVDKRDKFRFFGKPVTDDQVGSCSQAGSVLGVECLPCVQMPYGPWQLVILLNVSNLFGQSMHILSLARAVVRATCAATCHNPSAYSPFVGRVLA